MNERVRAWWPRNWPPAPAGPLLALLLLIQLAGFTWLVLERGDAPIVLERGDAPVRLVGLLVGAWIAWVLGHRLLRRAEQPLMDLSQRLSGAPGAAAVEGSVAPEGAGTAADGGLEMAVAIVQRRLSQRIDDSRRRRESTQDTGAQNTAFLRAVSHELRTPLNAILGFTDILLAGLEGDLTAGQRENLGIIRGSGQRLLEIFNDCIELSTMASGQLSLRRERVDVAGLLEEAVKGLDERRGARPIHLYARGPEPAVCLSAQRDRLLRVLVALGEYALSRTEAGAVGLLAEPAPAPSDQDGVRQLVITVVDGGPAMDAEALGALLRPERASDVTGRRLSLRLAIAEQLVELHGGRLELRPLQVGRSFAVALPIAEQAAAPPVGAVS